MSDSPKWTRRGFLEAIGRAGGAAAVYETMVAMGMIRVPQAFAGPPQIGCNTNEKNVVVLGAGIAGLTAAYELLKAGFVVTIVEAKGRAGGRSYTVRHGDTIEEQSGSTKTTQVCRFDAGKDFYLNAGPGRLPYHHTAILHYCTTLGVPLEVYTMMTRANYFQNDDAHWSVAGAGGPPPERPGPKTNRRIANDTRGWISELLAKCPGLDVELQKKKWAGVSKNDLLSLLTTFGDLDQNHEYSGSSRSGYVVEPGIESCGQIVAPLRLQALLSSEFWKHRFYQAEDYEWQPTLFQPVGGMDQIWEGFLRALQKYVDEKQCEFVYSAAVLDVRVEEKKASIELSTGRRLIADWVISTIPLPILAGIGLHGLREDYVDAIKKVKFEPTVKVGWQADHRFWETRDQMYGGISYTTDPITQIWYPSWAYFTQKGVLTGAYNYDDEGGPQNATNYGDMTPAERLDHAWKGLKKVHPEVTNADVPKELGISIAWQNIPYQRGGWAKDWGCGDQIPSVLLSAAERSRRFWVAGDQVSYLSGWQEGAVRSACHVLEQLAGKGCTCEWMKGEKVEGISPAAALRKAPSVRRRTRGLP